MGISSYLAFENCVAKILKCAGFSVKQRVPLSNRNGDIDIVAEQEGKKYFVEVKYSRINCEVIENVRILAEEVNMMPMIISAYPIAESIVYDEKGNKKYPDVELLDISNLLHITKFERKLRNELEAIIPYFLGRIEPQACSIEIDYLSHGDNVHLLIEQIRELEAGPDNASKYEDLCYELLKYAFSEELTLWKQQEKSNNELYRFDLLCRIKDSNQKTFWSILENFFKSKYVVFEFKNYKDKISQREIYTTEKYLYLKALRSVGIIFAANGHDNNAHWAAKGCLRENGKLIMLMDTEDLIKMVQMKMEQNDPSNYLMDKLDEILTTLEK